MGIIEEFIDLASKKEKVELAEQRIQSAEKVAHLLEQLDHDDLADELRRREDRIAMKVIEDVTSDD